MKCEDFPCCGHQLGECPSGPVKQCPECGQGFEPCSLGTEYCLACGSRPHLPKLSQTFSKSLNPICPCCGTNCDENMIAQFDVKYGREFVGVCEDCADEFGQAACEDLDEARYGERGFVALPILVALLAFLLVITACGGSGGGSPGSNGSSSPGIVPVVTPSVFDGRQYVNTGKYCTLGAGSPKWTCSASGPHVGCTGITQPSTLKMHAGAVDAWGSGFEPVTYNSGQFTLTSSGFVLQMAWTWSNDSIQAWSSSLAAWGAVVTLNTGCVVLFDDGGSV